MKTIFTLIILLSFVSISIGQVYTAFPSSNTLWTVRQGNGEADPAYYCYGLKAEDTVIGMRTYHKLYKSTDSILTAPEFFGGLREDGAKRVYYYNTATSSETMIYDFGLAVGDTLRITGAGGIVSSIDSVSINGQYRRRMNFRTYSGSPWLSGSWIEGLGNSSVGGLLVSPIALPTCDCAVRTLCFQQSGTWMYHNGTFPSTDCFGPSLGIEEPSVRASATLYPNPVTGLSHIRIDGNRAFTKLKLYSIGGAVVLNNDVSNQKDIVIDGTSLPAGLYYYHLLDNAGAGITGKFVVQ